MAAQIIDGKKIAAQVNEESRKEISMLARDHNFQPGLAVILIGEDPASQVYVNMKDRKCRELGIYSAKHVLAAATPQEEVLELIAQLNHDPKINGILVQSPPPPQIDEEQVVAAVDPAKDVDCFHPQNVGKMFIGRQDGFFPCTPYGVMVLLERSGIDPAGRHAVIVGRSNIVGKPMLALLVQKTAGANATVTCVHSRTRSLPELTRRADILIAAIGKPEFITADMIRENAVVVDVGMNRVEDAGTQRGYRLVGDVKFDEVAEKAAFITPVPGGVGPMTIAMLMHNTIKACKMQHGIKI
ncbi:MAG: bifunctional methylenetetrahydrofolate dehydrogenase/methenyltetrahydrofolate cyclohydrolase FolD [Victivallaceae bacterium]|nr:bifunctional methylenetetrahydrofolate dehydrogenase/methenyltetrahydrofolate cyclohydrolase FolD [Victivallaceae bacterium]